MCGIIGVIGKTSREELQSLLEPIKHRGTSHNEILLFSEGALGAHRLPIVDIEGGTQPAVHHEKKIIAVMNGEIFNRKKLKDDLIKKNIQVDTGSDVGLIPYLYDVYGENFVYHLDSEMYSIIIFDGEKNRWIVVRDPLGVKPLYYTGCASKMFFASEIKQLTKIRGVTKIEEFLPSHIWVNGVYKRYFSLNLFPSLEYNQEVSKRIFNFFIDAVHKRVPEDMEYGILLSGGLDSSAILLAAIQISKNIIAFIVGTKDSEDRKYAEQLCKQYKVSYHVVEPREPTYSDIQRLVRIVESDEPNTIRHSWVAYLVSEEASKYDLKVLLCGEGADELFGGYDVFKNISEQHNHRARYLLTTSLHRSQLPRVDRTGMYFTMEIRCPFLDKQLLEICFDLKITNIEGKTTKEVLRHTLKNFVPSYICNREKVPFSTGAGIFVDQDNSSFHQEIAKTGFSECELLSKFFCEYSYDYVNPSFVINKDNVLQHILEKPFI